MGTLGIASRDPCGEDELWHRDGELGQRAGNGWWDPPETQVWSMVCSVRKREE